ncbi:MAG: hypothetical protein ABIO70_17705 [Pseudomonadota bacterium]
MRAALAALLLAACGPLQPPAALLVEDPAAPFVVHAFTSPDLTAWTPLGAVAWSFSSLGAAVVDGELWVTGLQHLQKPTRWEELRGQLFVDLLASRDLAAWEVRRLPVDGPRGGLIDPAPLVDGERTEIWFARVPGTGDPAQGARPTLLFTGRLAEGRFGAVGPWAEGTDLLDPAPVRFRGRQRVFATRGHREVVEVFAEDAPRVILPDATVPHALVVGDELWLLAQQHREGRKVPILAKSSDGAHWSEPAVLDPDPHLRTCASPVLEPWGEGWVLLCVEEKGR